jgi:uncharacterized membrane protein
LQVVDVPRLLAVAQGAQVTIELMVIPGDTVGDSDVVAIVRGQPTSTVDEKAVLGALSTGLERTFEQDPTLAFRILTDIALRTLSPAINDPTTACQVLDATDGLLRFLSTRDLSPGSASDAAGITRVTAKLPGWDHYVALAIDEVVDYGAASRQVRVKLEALLTHLLANVPPERRPALQLRLDRIAALEPVTALDGAQRAKAA